MPPSIAVFCKICTPQKTYCQFVDPDGLNNVGKTKENSFTFPGWRRCPSAEEWRLALAEHVQEVPLVTTSWVATMARSPDPVHREVCAVLYRIREQRVEFGLVSTEKTSRWEFPHAECAANQPLLDVARKCVLEQAGMTCRESGSDSEPLDDVMATQDRQMVQLVAYLLEVDDLESTKSSRRTRWCFAEEARARIRRKPMRRLIDLALRRLVDQAGQ
jgi:hypothetical protein